MNNEATAVKASGGKKVFGIIKSILIWTVFAFAACMMVFTLISVTTVNKNDRSVFGYKFFIVLSDSMKATDFAAGDIIISKEVDPNTLEAGDIITFISRNPDNENFKRGDIITHKIREVTVDANGNHAFRTYGNTTNQDDEVLVTYEYVIGEYSFAIPKIGYFFTFMKTTPGYITCILVPFLILILSQAINVIRLFRRYKAEQMEELQAERAQLDQERAESQMMMEELMALKAELAANKASETATAPPAQEASQDAAPSATEGSVPDDDPSQQS